MIKVKDVREFFEGGVLSGDDFADRLAAEGYVIMKSVEGGYVPSSSLDERERAFRTEMTRERAINALKYELLKNGAHNPALAATAIGIDGLEGEASAVEEAARAKVANLKASEPYMFGSAAVTGGVSTGASHGGAATDPDMMSDSEYYRYKNVN